MFLFTFLSASSSFSARSSGRSSEKSLKSALPKPTGAARFAAFTLLCSAFSIFCFALTLLCASAQAEYSIKTVSVPIRGGIFAYGINDSGQVVGSLGDFSFQSHQTGFVETDGVVATFTYLGYNQTMASAINNAGQIVGTAFDGEDSRAGFLKTGSAFTTISYPGSYDTEPAGINTAGQIVGSFNYGQHGFLDSGGTYTKIDVPGAVTTRATGINSSGQIVGSYSDSTGTAHGFLYSGGTFTTLDDPVATDGTYPAAINDAGQIVGTYNGYTADQGTARGFEYQHGVYTDLNDPQALSSTLPTGINNHGVVSGYYDIARPETLDTTPVGFTETGGIYTDVDVLKVDATLTGINNAGQITGYYENSSTRHIYSFLGSGGVFTTIFYGFGGEGTETCALGLSNSGVVVGSVTGVVHPDGPFTHGFVDTNGSTEFLDYTAAGGGMGYGETTATGISDNQIVGWYEFPADRDTDTDPVPPAYGFLLKDGVRTAVSVPGAASTFPSGINTYPGGLNVPPQIVGTYDTGEGTPTHGFYETGNVYVTFDVPGAATTSPTDINNLGQIVGYDTDSAGETHGFIAQNGKFTVFDIPGAASTYPRSINDAGQIAGSYTDTSGRTQGFTATPRPQAPSPLTATASGGKVTLRWTAPLGPVTSYYLYRGTAAGHETFYKSTAGTSFVNATVTHGTKYYYTVKAVNAAGVSAASNEASATP